MKRITTVLLCCFINLLSFNVYSLPASLISLFVSPKSVGCAQAAPDYVAGFCPSFKTVARCHCTQRLPDGMCQDMKSIYKQMIGMFGTQLAACKWQKDVPVQTCMDDWNCYRLGGKDSYGRACSGTGAVCPALAQS